MNESAQRDWSSNASGWVANEAVFDAAFAPVTAAILAAAELAAGQRQLDLGCGTGTLLAAGAAAGATVTGVDISPGMAEAARARVPAAAVLLGDAQTMELPGPFDVVTSRFGVMFFDDPVAAFANLRRACSPGARLVFACWRSMAENPQFTHGTSVLFERLDPKPAPAPADAPGPTAFADGDRVASLLAAAGWSSVAVDTLDVALDFGSDTSDGVEERIGVILSTSTGRLAREQLEPRLGADGWAALVDEVRDELRRHLVDGRVRIPGACWLVTASN